MAEAGANGDLSAPAPTGARDAVPVPRDAPIGGQAVLEGVMMRGVSVWAVAVRKPAQPASQAAEGAPPADPDSGPIDVVSEPLVAFARRHKWARLPIIRGVVALVESLGIGFKALGISANKQLEGEDEEPIGSGTWAGTVAFALVFGIGLFFLLPAGITSIFRDSFPNSVVFVAVEKVIRIGIFLLYLWLISRMRDLQRVFEYHGAEHKTISCYEAGLELTPENAQRFSRFHPRCGTSFLLIVMIVAIFVFAPLGAPAWYWLLLSRVIGIPLVAGIAFEVIKLFGRYRRRLWARVLMWPGIQLQRLTTREPNLAQLAVAIAALEAVLAVENPREIADEDRTGLEVAA